MVNDNYRRLKPEEQSALLRNVGEAAGLGKRMPPGLAGFVQGVAFAYALTASNDFGHRWNEQAIDGLAKEIADLDRLGTTEEKMAEAMSYFGALHTRDGLRPETIVQSMGESDTADRTETGEFSICLLFSSEMSGGRSDADELREAGAQMIVRDEFIVDRSLAWMAMAAARMSRGGKISPVPQIRGWQFYFPEDTEVETVQARPPDGAPPAAWHPDPLRRHQYRYWDGRQWTDHVADNGVSSRDGIGLDGSPADVSGSSGSAGGGSPASDTAQRPGGGLPVPPLTSLVSPTAVSVVRALGEIPTVGAPGGLITDSDAIANAEEVVDLLVPDRSQQILIVEELNRALIDLVANRVVSLNEIAMVAGMEDVDPADRESEGFAMAAAGRFAMLSDPRFGEDADDPMGHLWREVEYGPPGVMIWSGSTLARLVTADVIHLT